MKVGDCELDSAFTSPRRRDKRSQSKDFAGAVCAFCEYLHHLVVQRKGKNCEGSVILKFDALTPPRPPIPQSREDMLISRC